MRPDIVFDRIAMSQEKDIKNAGPILQDSDSVYGWVSILLHWTTTIIVIALWIIGNNITSAPAGEIDARRALHVSIAGSAWLLLLFRVWWRIRSGHPHIRGQTTKIHRIARFAHYFMLVVVVLMLVSGPFLVWANGYPVTLFDTLSIPGPVGVSEVLRDFAWLIHENMATVLLLLVVIHIGGALKHLMFHTDDTIVRMIWPGRKKETDS